MIVLECHHIVAMLVASLSTGRTLAKTYIHTGRAFLQVLRPCIRRTVQMLAAFELAKLRPRDVTELAVELFAFHCGCPDVLTQSGHKYIDLDAFMP